MALANLVVKDAKLFPLSDRVKKDSLERAVILRININYVRLGVNYEEAVIENLTFSFVKFETVVTRTVECDGWWLNTISRVRRPP